MVAAVPQIEGLTVEDILAHAKTNPVLLKHLPDERDWVHIDRKWVCDVIFTLDRNNFQALITSAMKKRRDRLELSQNLLVEMRPEFAQALHSCLNFSSKLLCIDLCYSFAWPSQHYDEWNIKAQANERGARRGQGGRG